MAFLGSRRSRIYLRRGVAACSLGMAVLTGGCGPGEELVALHVENEQLREQLERSRDQINELRSSLGAVRVRIRDIHANIRIGAYARYGRSLAADLEALASSIDQIDARADDAGQDLR